MLKKKRDIGLVFFHKALNQTYVTFYLHLDCKIKHYNVILRYKQNPIVNYTSVFIYFTQISNLYRNIIQAYKTLPRFT